MRKIYVFILLFFSFSLFAAEVKIIKMEGEVEYRESVNSQWTTAQLYTIVPEGGAVKTGINGSAVLDTGNKSVIWMKENTAVEIEQKKDLITRLGLVFGKIKARVPHLKRREKYDIRTNTAVCAVRGTDLVLETDMEGKMKLQVLFGAVKVTYAMPPLKGEREFLLSQGEYITIKGKDKPARKMMMDKKMEIEGLAKWDPGLTDSARLEDINKKQQDRAQIRDFSAQTLKTENIVKNFAYKGRESDIEAGRTLRDVHGNLVRVDQRLLRPQPDTIQFINLVKRPVYNYVATRYSEFRYNGPQSVIDRYDMAVFTMNFNRNLPQSISEWPSFFNENSVDPNWATFVFANRTDSSNILFSAEPYKYDAVRDELINNELAIGYTFPVSGLSGENYSKVIDRDIMLVGKLSSYNELSSIINFDFKGDSNGVLTRSDGVTYSDAFWFSKVQACNTPNCTNFYERTGEVQDLLYQISADLYAKGGNYLNTSNLLWYARENYVISNDGRIRGKNNFVSSGNDIFSLLKESAGQSIVYFKRFDSSQGLDWSKLTRDNVRSSISNSDYFSGSASNIDLVVIPDLALAGVQKVLPALGNLKN